MKWELPPVIKIYEALGAIGDDRLQLLSETEAKIWSSSRQKYYSVVYDAEQGAIMANDNGSYYRSYLGYPSVAFLMRAGKVSFNKTYSDALAGIEWKDINVRFKNDFARTQQHVDELLKQKGINLTEFHGYLSKVMEELRVLELTLLGPKVNPPEGY